MKNIFVRIIFILCVNLIFSQSIYCQPVMNDDCCYEYPVCCCSEDFESCVDDCDVSGSYRYFSLGVGPIIFIPNVGIGYRQRNCHFGWDTSLSFSTIGYVHQLSAHFVGHYYLSPYRQDSGYLGFGLMGSGVFENSGHCGGTLSPDFVFGKELFRRCGDGRHFIEMHVAIPTLWLGLHHHNATFFPLMFIKYGMSF